MKRSLLRWAQCAAASIVATAFIPVAAQSAPAAEAAPAETAEEQFDAVMPNAQVMVIRSDGNEDRRFSIISEGKKIPLVLFEKNMEMGDAFGSLFNK